MSLRSIVGWVLLLAGAAAIAMPWQHPGGHALTATRNLLWGGLSLALGAFLARARPGVGAGVWLSRAGLAISPLLLFVTLYAALAEVEEVVLLRTPDGSDTTWALRLWIVDRDDAEWVAMPGAKADAHGLDAARVELVRAGRARCVFAERSGEQADAVAAHRLRDEKYAVQRLATAVGVFDTEPPADLAAIRLTPCPDA